MQSRWPLVVLGLLATFGAALRFYQAGESLWIDELHTGWCALGTLADVAPRATMGNQSPLFFWLEWLLVHSLGASELTLRLPSLIAGTLLPGALYWLTARWTKSPWLGVLAAGLAVVDHLTIFYATEARPYALVQLLAVVHVAVTMELAERSSLRLRMAWVLGAALLFYLHYTAALLFAGEVLFFVVMLTRSQAESNRRSVLRLAVDLALLTLLILPATNNLLAIYSRRANWEAFVPQQSVWNLFSLLPWSGSLVFVILAVAAHRWLRPRQKLATPLELPPAAILLAACWLLVPLVLVWTATATDAARLFFPRYLVASAPAAFVLTAMCVRLVPWRCVQIPLSAALLIYALYSSQIIQQFRYDGRIIGDRQEDWRGAIAWLNGQLPKNRYPVLVYSGLIEANDLSEQYDTDLKTYCLYPVASLYPINDKVASIVPLPRRAVCDLTRETNDLIIRRGGFWIVTRGQVPFPYAVSLTSRKGLRYGTSDPDVKALNGGRYLDRWWDVHEFEMFGDVRIVRLMPEP